MDYASHDPTRYHQPFLPPMERSTLGIVSVGVAIAVMIGGQMLFSVFFQILAAMNDSYYTRLIIQMSPLWRAFSALLCLVGLSLGIAGMLQSERQRDLPVVGILLNAVSLSGNVLSFTAPLVARAARGLF